MTKEINTLGQSNQRSFNLLNQNKPQNFDIYKPAPNTRRIPEANYQSPTLQYASKYIPTQIMEPNRAGADAIVDQAHLGKEMDLRAAIRGSLQADDGIDVGQKVQAAQLALEIGATAPSVGTTFQKNTYPGSPVNVSKVIDTKLTKDDLHSNILTNLGEDPALTTIENVFNEGRQEFTDLISETLSQFTSESLKELASFMPEGGATRNILEHFTTKGDGTVTQVFEDADVIQAGLASRLGEEIFPRLGLDKHATLKDTLEFLSFMPKDPKADVDIENMVKIVFSKDTLDNRMARLTKWDDEFRGKYGENGYVKLASFMVKEGVVDAASLALALRNPRLAGKLIAGSKDAILTRLTKALGRASVMGVGGTGVQASIDSYLGFETNVPVELGGRVAGAFVGEGIGRALLAAGRGILGAGSKLINKGEQLFGASGQKASTVSPDVLAHSISDVAPSNVQSRMLRDTMTEFNLAPESMELESLATTITRAAQSSNTQPYRDLANQVTGEMRKGSTGNLGHIFDLTESEIQSQVFGAKTLKHEIMLQGVGNKIIGETVAKQTEVDNVLNYYFDHGLRTVAHREGALQGDTSFFRVKELFSEPRNIVGKIADDLFDEQLNKDVYQKAMLQAQEEAFKGLNKNATKKVLAVRSKFEQISEKNKDFRVTPQVLDSYGLTQAEQDSYWAVGKLLDFSAILSENLMIQSAAKKGLKQVPDGRLVQVVSTQEDGISVVKEIGFNKPEIQIATAEVQDVKRILGYKRNFVPRRAKDPDYLLATLDTKTGEISTQFASKYRGEMQDKLNAMDADLAGTSKVAFYWRNMTDEKSLNFGLGNNSMSIVDSLDEPAINRIRQTLSATGDEQLKDLDIENLRLAFDTLTYGSVVSQQVAGRRGTQGLKTVTGEAFEYKPADEAITQHLMETSALQFRDFRSDAIKQFEKEFAGVLDRTKNWDQPIPNILGQSDMVERAKSIQGFIKRNIFNETAYGKEVRLAVDAWADRMRKAGGVNRAMVDNLERMPIVENAFKSTRDGTAMFRATASALTFAGNIGSYITQVAPSAAMIVGIKGITNPSHLITGWKDMFGAFSIRAGLPENLASKESREALRAIEKSGILAKADMSDLANAAYGQSNTLFNKAMFFVSKGEEANRANIWFTIRAEMKDKLAKGEVLSLNGSRVLEPNELDNTEFLQIVSEKAKQIFLDTTGAGRLKALTGVGSLFGMFTAPIIKTHTMWFAKGLSRTEKIGASLGLFSFYGINAIPFVAAGLYGANKAGEWVAGGDELDDFKMASDIANNVGHTLLDGVGDLAGFSEEDKQFFIDVTNKGLVSTLSGGELDIYHKMSIGLFIKESIDKTEDPLAAIPMLSILTKAGESASNIYQMLGDLYLASQDDVSEEERIVSLRNFMGEVANQVGNALPGFGKIVDTMNNHPDTKRLLNPELEGLDDKGWVTRSGKRVAPERQFTERDRLLNILGITPSPVQENREVMSGQFDRVQILKDIKNEWRDRYKNAGTPAARTRVMQEAMKAAYDAEEILMATYNGALSVAAGHTDNTPYRPGTLAKQWQRSFVAIDMERIAGNRTMSKGE